MVSVEGITFEEAFEEDEGVIQVVICLKKCLVGSTDSKLTSEVGTRRVGGDEVREGVTCADHLGPCRLH